MQVLLYLTVVLNVRNYHHVFCYKCMAIVLKVFIKLYQIVHKYLNMVVVLPYQFLILEHKVV